eukprot:COSAG04_NODE_3278_length_2981_cov_1.788688_6_plen_123_part_00
MVVRRLGLKQNSLIMLDADPHRKNFGRSPRNASPTRPSTVPTSPGRKGRPVSIPYSSKTRAKGETPTKPSLTPVVPGDRVYARQHCPQIRSVSRAEVLPAAGCSSTSTSSPPRLPTPGSNPS